MRFEVLGGLAVSDGGRPLDLGTPKQRAIVAVLLLERDQVVATDRLIELLWGDEAEKAVVSLRAYVSRLRAVLEPDRRPRDPASILVRQAPGYRLVVARSDVDLHRFEDEVAEGRRLLRAGDHAGSVRALDDALALWTGPLLPELATEPFVVAAAARAAEVRVAAVEAAGEAWLGLGEPHEAVVRLEGEAAAAPTRERLQGLLALALYRSERQAEALRVIDRCRRALGDDHGLEPGADLKRLEADVLAQAAGLAGPRGPAGGTPVATATPGAPRAVAPTGRREVPIVGRAHEQAVVAAALAEATAGRGSVVVVVGEAGIGKSRLAEAAADLAAASGVATAWARCPASGATPPYWVWTQLSRQLAAPVPGGDRDAAPSDFGVHRSALDAIAAVTADRTLLAVVDDLQWADPDSLRLIEHIAADLAATGLVLVVTVRPLDDGAPDALVDCLAEVARVPTARQLELTGLRAADVAAWLHGRDDVDAPDEVAAVLHERTGGNPLFVKELTDLLAAEGRLDDVDAVTDPRAIPPGVRFVVRRRVSRLPRAAQTLLTTAAVVGSPFRVETLAAVTGRDPGTLLADAGPALDEGLLVEVRDGLAFSHALVADALAGEVNAARRAAIHAAAARALAEAAGPDLGADAAVIAHHARAGMLAGTGELAVESALRAAAVAAARLAHEDAAGHWADAAAALAVARPGDAAGRIDALIAQADALTQADQTEAAKEPILAAVDAAAGAGLTDAMVRAASLLNHTHVWTNEAYGAVDPRLVDALERTLAALGDDDDGPARAVLLGALAAELVFADEERHRDVCARAERAARATGDPVVVARVLNNLMLPNRPGQLAERRGHADEMVAIAAAHPVPAGLAYAAHHHVAEADLEVGALDRAAEALAAGRRVLEGMPRSHLHGQHLWAEAAVAVATGRYDEASDLVTRAHELHRRGRFYDADTLLLAGRAAIAIDHGGLDDLLPFAVATAGSTAYGRNLVEAMAFAVLEAGDGDLARSLSAPFGPDHGFTDDYSTLAGATAALHVRVELGDEGGADAVAALLAPYAGRWAGAGTAPLSLGPVGLALARHQAMRGDADAAGRGFAAAVAVCEGNGAVAWRARALAHQAAFLRAAGDGDGAGRTRAEAAALATRHGLPYVARRLAAEA